MSTENKCGRCKYLDRYYTKGVTKFDKTEFGWCMVKMDSVNVFECCERYEKRKLVYKASRRAKACLNDLLTEISEIRKIIEAEQDEQD